MTRVWIDHLDFECCNDPFHVGDEVTWRAVSDDGFLPDLRGVEPGDDLWSGLVHGADDQTVAQLHGTVRRIRLAHARVRRYDAGDHTVVHPVPRSLTLTEVDGVTDNVEDIPDVTDDDGRALEWVGFLVDLAP